MGLRGSTRSIAGALLVALVAILVSLFPKPENDLFFELRTGNDILRTHHVPHVDAYSWVSRGKEWDVPEWLSFVLYALAFRAVGFAGTMLLTTCLTVACGLVVWFYLLRRLSPLWAFQLVNLMLLAMTNFIQERPYTFTYVLLPVGLAIVLRARKTGLSPVVPLVLLCVVWANLHQGVLAFVALLAAFAVGDAIDRVVGARQGARTTASDDDETNGVRRASPVSIRTSARPLFNPGVWLLVAACAAAAIVSPYGWRIYRNVAVTLGNPAQMSSVTEWKPVTIVPFGQLEAYVALVLIVTGALALSGGNEVASGHDWRRGRRWSDVLVVICLFVESGLHARNIPLFAIGALVVCRDHFASASERLRSLLGLPEPRPAPSLLLGGLAAIYLTTLGLVTYVSIRRASGPGPLTPSLVGQAVARSSSYPELACAFMEREGFPPNLRLLNNFEIGGYLIWRMPSEPVFTDGRLDLYSARQFDDMMTLAGGSGSTQWSAIVKREDFDCVVTTVAAEAHAFERLPDWRLVYEDPHRPRHLRCRILLRATPELMPVIERCQRANVVVPPR